jgi:hypothetical protein
VACILASLNIRCSRWTIYLVRPHGIRNPGQFSVAVWPAAVGFLKLQAYLGTVMKIYDQTTKCNLTVGGDSLNF